MTSAVSWSSRIRATTRTKARTSPTTGSLFGASAHCALAARELAAQVYGEAPHHGYVFGGSGGGSRSIYCLENRPDVYDGASPHAIWSSPLV